MLDSLDDELDRGLGTLARGPTQSAGGVVRRDDDQTGRNRGDQSPALPAALRTLLGDSPALSRGTANASLPPQLRGGPCAAPPSAALSRSQTHEERAGLSITCQDTVNAVLDHLRMPLVDRVAFRNTGYRPYENLSLRLGGGSTHLGEWTQSIGRLRGGESFDLADVRVPINHAALRGVVEQTTDALRVEVLEAGQPVASRTIELRVQPYRHWPLMLDQLWTLAAFVWPNQPAVQEFIAEAADAQEAASGSRSFEGYQGDTRRVLAQVRALHDAIAGLGGRRRLDYINPPASFCAVDGSFGQKIRSPDSIRSEGRGTCLDLTVLLASLLEQVGLSPVMVVIAGHAFAGCWMRDGMRLANKCENLLASPQLRQCFERGELLLFNSTNLCEGQDLTAAAAVGASLVGRNLADVDAGREPADCFVQVIDVRACRDAGVSPLPPG